MTEEQLRAARALLRLGTRDLAAIAGVDKMAIVRAEAGRKSHVATIEKIRKALENAGVVFLDGKQGEYHPTAALRWGAKPNSTDQSVDELSEKSNDVLYSRAWDDEDCEDTIGITDLSEDERVWLNYVRTNPNLSERGRKILLKTVRL